MSAETSLQKKQTDRPDMPTGYGLKPADDPAGMLPWAWISQRMAQSRNYWVCTTRPDGRPHVAPVWGVWINDACYFGTDPKSRKTKNLLANPAVAIHLESGDEVVIIEGVAEIFDPAENEPLMAQLDRAYAAKYKMTLTAAGGGAILFVVRPQTALAWLESDFPNTATRWRSQK